MSTFCGTQDKCKACDKTVHFIDLLTADGVNYHKSCFRCSQCNGNLTMCNYSSMDGVLYCKPHFEKLFKETGTFNKRFLTPPKSRSKDTNSAPSRVSSMFSGTQDKCAVCNKTAYPLEKITMEGENYHNSCFRCSHGGCKLTTSNYASLNGILYCKHHFAQLFMEKGSYSKLAERGKKLSADHSATQSECGEVETEEVEAKAESNPETTETEP